MSTTTPTTPTPTPTGLGRTLSLFLVPVVLLTGVIALFLYTNGAGLNVEPAAPIEALSFERTVFRPGQIEVCLLYTSPSPRD